MSQPVGFPGGGVKLSKSVSIFTGLGSPNTSAVQQVQLAGVGSLFLQGDAGDTTHALWVCTTAGSFDAPTGVTSASIWTPK